MTANNTEFSDAIDEGDVAVVRKMLAATPSLIESRNEYGFTPLMSAVSCRERSPELVQALIEAGANVNARSDDGYTPLHMMIDANGPTGTGKIPGQIARLLVDAGADVEARQHWGWTPLMRAALEGTADELQALVDVGANLNNVFPDHTLPVCFRGHTSLMATIGFAEKTRIMIEAGVNVMARHAHGQTAIEVAHQTLAEAEEQSAEPHEDSGESMEEALSEELEQLKKRGIDPNAPMDDTGITYKQLLEQALEDTAARAAGIDIRAEIRKSIAYIEKALAER